MPRQKLVRLFARLKKHRAALRELAHLTDELHRAEARAEAFRTRLDRAAIRVADLEREADGFRGVLDDLAGAVGSEDIYYVRPLPLPRATTVASLPEAVVAPPIAEEDASREAFIAEVKRRLRDEDPDKVRLEAYMNFAGSHPFEVSIERIWRALNREREAAGLPTHLMRYPITEI